MDYNNLYIDSLLNDDLIKNKKISKLKKRNNEKNNIIDSSNIYELERIFAEL